MELQRRFVRKCFKVRYESKAEAKAEVVRINRKYKNRPDWKPLKDVYFCEECQSWHNTSMEKANSRKLTKFKNKQKK